MELRQLEAFVHVAEFGSFTRAAAMLGTDQPALSRLVRQLEVQVRHTLLERNGRGVTLTPAGQLMLAHAQGVLQQVQRAVQDLDELHGTLRGHFSIGVIPSFARVATLELVRHFRASFPNATISVTQGLSTYLVEWLAMGRIDVAVMYDTFETPLINKRTVHTEELFLIGPSDDKSKRTAAERLPKSIALSEIGRYPLVIPSRMHAIRRVLEAAAEEQGIKLNIELEMDAVTSILDLVAEGVGYALLALNATESDALKRRFHAIRVTGPTLHTRLVLATSRAHPLSRLATQATAMLESHVVPLYGRASEHADKARRHRSSP
ncbi:LysR family transcriptional regulator [Paraburkholderia phosphatilytica]|uniref:LysR family transcriptional regulator n=1 Tax=Paraburkholderia phosphatilytica TaxID=2282883 RepID=UPI000E50EBC5|nr:LysR family transcriptional regulator [Paraburkholderia phosphatilytica]